MKTFFMLLLVGGIAGGGAYAGDRRETGGDHIIKRGTESRQNRLAGNSHGLGSSRQFAISGQTAQTGLVAGDRREIGRASEGGRPQGGSDTRYLTKGKEVKGTRFLACKDDVKSTESSTIKTNEGDNAGGDRNNV